MSDLEGTRNLMGRIEYGSEKLTTAHAVRRIDAHAKYRAEVLEESPDGI